MKLERHNAEWGGQGDLTTQATSLHLQDSEKVPTWYSLCYFQLWEKKKFPTKQNKALHNRTALPIHTSVPRFPGTHGLLAGDTLDWIDHVHNHPGLVLVLSCGYALVVSRLLCFVWNLYFFKMIISYPFTFTDPSIFWHLLIHEIKIQGFTNYFYPELFPKIKTEMTEWVQKVSWSLIKLNVLSGYCTPGQFLDCFCIFSQKLQHIGNK